MKTLRSHPLRFQHGFFMKKPLGSEEPAFYIVSGRNLHILDHSSVGQLLDAANRSLASEIENPIVYMGERALYQDEISGWLDRIARGESRESLIEDLNAVIQHVPYTHVLGQSESGSPRWEHYARMDEPVDPSIRAAHGIAHFLASGGFLKLRRCKAVGCGHFYLGPPQSFWCSENCGSRERGRRKRSKDRRHRFAP